MSNRPESNSNRQARYLEEPTQEFDFQELVRALEEDDTQEFDVNQLRALLELETFDPDDTQPMEPISDSIDDENTWLTPYLQQEKPTKRKKSTQPLKIKQVKQIELEYGLKVQTYDYQHIRENVLKIARDESIVTDFTGFVHDEVDFFELLEAVYDIWDEVLSDVVALFSHTEAETVKWLKEFEGLSEPNLAIILRFRRYCLYIIYFGYDLYLPVE